MTRTRKSKKPDLSGRPCAACGEIDGPLGVYRSMTGDLTAVHPECAPAWFEFQSQELMRAAGGCVVCGGGYMFAIRGTAQFRVLGAGTDKWVHAHCWKNRRS